MWAGDPGIRVQTLSPPCASVSPLRTLSLRAIFALKTSTAQGSKSPTPQTPSFSSKPLCSRTSPEQQGDSGCSPDPPQTLPTHRAAPVPDGYQRGGGRSCGDLVLGNHGWLDGLRGTGASPVGREAADPPPARLAGPRMGPQWLAPCHVSPLGDTEKQSPRPRTHSHPRVPEACVADLIPFRARVPVRDSWVL